MLWALGLGCWVHFGLAFFFSFSPLFLSSFRCRFLAPLSYCALPVFLLSPFFFPHLFP
ncbi:hypothetical protein COLO4_20730 [Corchorus olitorius]|uniref:Uncharacterized protein n=1 Tax=Corchorus olitorius TaxID=93759 RepID=A0A1R3IXC2_9ROSI|nr:hypothetical protein COLO4_20730 [Corchorus olitorius]